MTVSGLSISTSVDDSISPATTVHGPVLFKIILISVSVCILRATSLIFNIMSVTSSLTPEIAENSCKTPSILTEVIALPCNEDNRILRKELPIVNPNPFSSGSTVSLETFLPELSSFISILFGFISSCQFFSITTYLFDLFLKFI